MPLFHDQKLVFIHIPKNAGKSVEEAFLGKNAPALGRRTRLSSASKYLLTLVSPKAARVHLIGSLDYTFAAQHMTLHEMESLGLLIGCEHYRVFAVIRNPFERIVSSVFLHYHAAIVRGALPADTPDDFERLLAAWLDHVPRDHNQIAHRRTQTEFVYARRRKLADVTLLRQERLQEDFANFAKVEGLQGISLPWLGKGARKNSYRDYHNDRTRRVVESVFGEDLENFRYVF